MKKQISRALLGLAATFVLAVAANAQTLSTVVINIPFNFVAGGKQMSAGRYAVGRVKSDSESALIIRSVDGHNAAVILTNAGEARPHEAALGFRQLGDTYFLATVSMPNTASVRELSKSSAERRLERELAEQKSGESKDVTVVGSVR